MWGRSYWGLNYWGTDYWGGEGADAPGGGDALPPRGSPIVRAGRLMS